MKKALLQLADGAAAMERFLKISVLSVLSSLFLAILAGTAVSLAVIPIAGLVIVYYLQKQDGGFFDTSKRERLGS